MTSYIIKLFVNDNGTVIEYVFEIRPNVRSKLHFWRFTTEQLNQIRQTGTLS